MVKYMAVAVAVAVAVSGAGAVAVAVAGLTKRFFNHIQKDFLINAWVYRHSPFTKNGSTVHPKNKNKKTIRDVKKFRGVEKMIARRSKNVPSDIPGHF